MSQPPAGPPYGQDPNQGPGQYPGQQGAGQQYGQQPGGYPPPGQQYGGSSSGDQQYPYGGQSAQPAYGAGSGPGAFPGPGGGTGTGKAPKEVETSFKLWLAYIAVSLIGSIVAFLSIGPLIDTQLRAQGLDPADLPPGFAETLQTSLVIGSVLGLVLLAAIVAVVFQMRKGRNWARIVLAVLGGIAVLSGLAGLAGLGTTLALGGLGVVSVLLSVVQLLLLIGALLFMFRGAANPYFAARR